MAKHVVLVLTFLALILVPVKTYAQSTGYQAKDLFSQCDANTNDSAVCKDKNRNDANPQNETKNSLYGPNGIVSTVVRLYAIGTGIVAVVMIIIGGFKYTTAAGDPNNVKSAKNTILYALIGLGIASLSGLILQFVLVKL